MMDIVSLTILLYVCPITREVKLNGHAEKISHKLKIELLYVVPIMKGVEMNGLAKF